MDLDERFLDLHRRLQRGGAYLAPPVRRVEIPKPDGGTRPLGIAALEDKFVQKTVVDVILLTIYETGGSCAVERRFLLAGANPAQ